MIAEALEDRLLLAADMVISEFMANNTHTLGDAFGEFPDWVELHNRGDQAADLTGWYMTDTASNLTEWQFPAGTTVQPGAYLVVYASGRNTVIGVQIHTNFKLNASGEYLALVQPDGATVQFDYGPQFPPQTADVSYGMTNEDLPGSPFQYFTVPTPWNRNAPAADVVSFSRPGGAFTSASIPLALSTDTPNAQIRYTTNGQIPTNGSFLYTGPITINRDMIIRARAYAPNLTAGVVTSESFFALDSSTAYFNSNLPLVVLDTGGQALSQTLQAATSAMIIDTSGPGRASLTDSPEFIGRAGLNIRGQSSVSFPKQQWHFELWDEKNNDQAASLLGMPAGSDWVLYAPYSEKSLMQNQLEYMWSNRIGDYAVRTRWVEVFLNTLGTPRISYTSNYWGLYLLMEKIKIDPNRVDIAKLGPGDNTEPAVTGGYIWKKDKIDPGETGFTTSSGQTFLYEDPAKTDLTGQQQAWLTNYLNQFEAALNGPNFKDPVNGYAKYIDVDSWIDNWILVEMAKNIDGFRLSTYYYKDRGGKIHMGPVWDYNLSMGNANYNGGDVPTGWYHTQLSNADYPYWNRLFQDPDFNQRLIDRWESLRHSLFSTSQMMADLDANYALLTDNNGNYPVGQYPSQTPNNPVVRNFEKWNILGTYVWPNAYIGTSYLDEVNHLKSFMSARLAWIDSQFLAMPQFSRQSGTLSGPFSLAVTGPSGARVYYTTDGSDPRLPGGAINPTAILYNAAIGITGDTHVRARAWLNGTWSGINDAVFAADKGLRITQLMYNPPAPPSGGPYGASDFEFIELTNTSSQSINLAGYQFTKGVTFTFPSEVLAPGSKTVVVSNLAAFQSLYGTSLDVAGQYSGNLDNGGEEIQLQGPLGQVVQDFTYDDKWYPQTDGGGYSLIIVNPSMSLSAWNQKSGWRASNALNGSPDASDVGYLPDSIVISEVLSNTAQTSGNFIELHNRTAAPIDVSGWFLSDTADDLTKYAIPPGSIIAASGYLVFYQNTEFGGAFQLSRVGGEVHVSSVDASGQLGGYRQAVDFGPADPEISFGRYDKGDGDADFTATMAPTPGAANAPPLVGPVIINELMYNPSRRTEYIELHNITSVPVPLYDPANPQNTWKFTDGIDYALPSGATIGAGSYALVVPVDPAVFRASYNVPPGVQVWGPYTRRDQTNVLSNAGENLELSKPVQDGSAVDYVIVDHVHYDSSEGSWPIAADGMGSSLSRLGNGYGNNPANWAAEPIGSPGWVNFDHVAPTVTISPITPSLQRSPVNTVVFVFSKPVAGFSLASLKLSLSGGANLITGLQTLTTSDGVTWTLSNLAVAQGAPGAYTLSINSNSGVTDFGNNPLSSAAAISWTFQPPSAVVGRYVFYNHSAFDGNDPAAGPADDAAIATDKQPLLPGGTATFANYTSYSRGINGIMIDLSGSVGNVTAGDFSFATGNDTNFAAWAPAPDPTAIVARPGAGTGGSTRIEITWADGAIHNQWLRITMSADAATNLAASDVFYFGNAIGESGNSPSDALVNSADEVAARNDPHSFLNPASITNAHDYNRDGRVDAIDQLIARNNGTITDTSLPLLSVPVAMTSSPARAPDPIELLKSRRRTAVLRTAPAVLFKATRKA